MSDATFAMDDGEEPKRPTNADKLAAIHSDALEQFNAIMSALRVEREECLEDRKFVYVRGSQWKGQLEKQFANRPQLEVNKVKKSVNDIIDDFRAAMIDVNFVSKDGSDADELADACAAAYRSDEQDSSADQAHLNAFQELVSGGVGAWRLRTKYEDDEADDDEDEPQRVMMEPIVDADVSVYWDLNSKLQDKSDARFCFVVTSMTFPEYKLKYDDDPASWPKETMQYWDDWVKGDFIYVAEYYLKEWKKDVCHVYQGLDEDEPEKEYDESKLDADEDIAIELAATGYREVRTKKVKRQKVHKYILNGNEVLEDCKLIAGREIPIIMAYGNRVFIENIERVQGHVRDAKDSQRVKNMIMSMLAVLAACSPVEKPIVLPEQIKGFEPEWERDNIENYAYLRLNPTFDAQGQQINGGPVGYTKAANVPPALPMLMGQADKDMEEILGGGQQSEKILSHVSGKAVEATREQIDRKSSRYIDNFGMAIRWNGIVWLGMAKDVYTQAGRKMKGVSRLGQRRQIEIQKPTIGPDGKMSIQNDFSRAKFDVAVTVGPSSDSQRDSTVRTITGMLPFTQDPETQLILTLTAMMNIQGEGVENVRRWAHQKLVKLGAEQATPEEAQKMQAEAQAAQPTPNDQYLAAAAKAEEAKAQKDAADTQLITARIDETKANTIGKLAEIDAEKQKAAMAELMTLSDVTLAHKQSAVDTAESLHGMLTQPDQNTPGSAQ